MITNKHNIPPLFERALAMQRKKYAESRGNSDYTKSDLIRPVRMSALQKRHGKERRDDISKHLDSLMGVAMHKVIEEAAGPNELAEKRKYVKIEVDGKIFIVSAQLDNLHLETGTLRDLKTTKVWSYKLPAKAEWEADLNIQAWILRVNAYEIRRLLISGYLKDWSHRRATEEDYPPIPFFEKEFALWPMDKAAEFVRSRIRAHEQAKALPDSELPECSQEERWGKPETWAVKKIGGKRAVPGGRHTSKDEAETMLSDKGEGYEIEHRPAENLRCEKFCVVSHICTQYQAMRRKDEAV